MKNQEIVVRRKPENQRKTEYLRFRVTAAHKQQMLAAAEQAGIHFSAWAVERLLRCAKTELAES